jgi:hypothetical protein
MRGMGEKDWIYYMAGHLGCWLAGWPVTGGLDTCMGGAAGMRIMYEIVIEILYLCVKRS